MLVKYYMTESKVFDNTMPFLSALKLSFCRCKYSLIKCWWNGIITGFIIEIITESMQMNRKQVSYTYIYTT